MLAGPGDRRDEDLVAIAHAVAGRFDHYVCRRDDALRGREPDEVPRIQAAALRAQGVPEAAISIIPDEQDAIDAALHMGQPGDLLLVFSDALVRSWKQITKFKPSDTAPAAAEAVAAAVVGRGSGIAGAARSLSRARGRGCREDRGIQLRRPHPRRARGALRAGGRRLTVTLALPFDDSRRLTGSNLYFPTTGAVLEVVGIETDDALVAGWRSNVARARARLGWDGEAACVARQHATGTSLAIAAPCDQLFTATEVNEWALCAVLHDRDPMHWCGLLEALREAAQAASPNPASAIPAEIEEGAALARLERIAAGEARPDLRALIGAARTRGVPFLLDDDTLSLGDGSAGRSFAIASLPCVADVPWGELRAVPTALVTGSNGKTTTVRLIAACAQAHGWRAGYCCTDGVFVDGTALDTGDYSGPAGARLVLRNDGVEAAVLETARGGILRRGLAVTRADAAIVTNVSADHFGEYGIHDLGALADVKLTVGSVLRPGGVLVLNADDATLRGKVPGLERRFGHRPAIAWFATDADDALLAACRADGGMTCGVRAGRLVLSCDRIEHDLGSIADMPLTVEGRAAYNVANLAGAALAAVAMGVAPAGVAAVYARFGSRVDDNPGRMMRFDVNGVRVLVDYAHNPDGLGGLLQVAVGLQGAGGRLGLLLGHAGNREDRDIERLAETAATFGPALVVVKELASYRRGREPGEVPRILRATLLRAGLPESALPMRPDEVTAVRCALDWARPGDVLVLPVHGLAARTEVLALLRRQAEVPGLS